MEPKATRSTPARTRRTRGKRRATFGGSRPRLPPSPSSSPGRHVRRRSAAARPRRGSTAAAAERRRAAGAVGRAELRSGRRGRAAPARRDRAGGEPPALQHQRFLCSGAAFCWRHVAAGGGAGSGLGAVSRCKMEGDSPRLASHPAVFLTLSLFIRRSCSPVGEG